MLFEAGGEKRNLLFGKGILILDPAETHLRGGHNLLPFRRRRPRLRGCHCVPGSSINALMSLAFLERHIVTELIELAIFHRPDLIEFISLAMIGEDRLEDFALVEILWHPNPYRKDATHILAETDFVEQKKQEDHDDAGNRAIEGIADAKDDA
jgi:hypothetical protein